MLVTTLTQRIAEDLADYLAELGLKVRYLHSEMRTLRARSRSCVILRLGVHDVVVGIDLLREGLDLPEVSLVAILVPTRRVSCCSDTALVQTIGQSHPHVNGQADHVRGQYHGLDAAGH